MTFFKLLLTPTTERATLQAHRTRTSVLLNPFPSPYITWVDLILAQQFGEREGVTSQKAGAVKTSVSLIFLTLSFLSCNFIEGRREDKSCEGGKKSGKAIFNNIICADMTHKLSEKKPTFADLHFWSQSVLLLCLSETRCQG